MTTHSPFIVRGAPLSSKVYWVKDGVIESENRREVELALGWGAFGKKIIIISEDQDTSFIKKLIAQWPHLDKFITFYPGTGYTGIPSPAQAAEIRDALGGKYKIVVHRDRDSLTDQEVELLRNKYSEKGVSLWFPDQSDIEAYFCVSEFIQSFIGCSVDEANAYVDEVLTQHAVPINQQFNKHRASHNDELYKAGGSPTNDVVWSMFQSRSLKGARGKFVFKQLKNKIPGNAFREEAILNHRLQVEIASDLKNLLNQLLAE